MDKKVLVHHGTKGMRWGVRRYQNKDGSLTPAGKKRYADADAHDDYKKAHDNKDVRTMSDAELRSRNNRLQMEQQYDKLTAKKVSAGRKFVTGVVIGAATSVATTYAIKYMTKGVEYAGGKISTKVVPKAASAIKKMTELDIDFKNIVG